jgi:peptide/nickel transport system permease protein
MTPKRRAISLSRMARRPVVSTAAALGCLLLLLAIFGPMFMSASPHDVHPEVRLEPPSWLGGHGFFGTDQVGRDLFVRSLYGLRTTMVVASCAVLIGASIGTFLGVVSGFFGGAVDALVMRWADVQQSFPGLLLAMVFVAALGGGRLVLILFLGLNHWMLYARVIRSAVISLKQTDLVTASNAIGARSSRILVKHVVPNVTPALVAIITVELPALMLAEASLSFLGYGVQPPTISLGSILASGRDFIQTQWWMVTLPGVVLALAALCPNVVGSWMMQVGDPTLRSAVVARRSDG